MTRFYDDALAPVGIEVNQFAILGRLDRLGPGPMQDLAADLVMDRTTLTRLQKALEALGLVSVAPRARDRRLKIVAFATLGAALVTAARPLWAEASAATRPRSARPRPPRCPAPSPACR